MLSWAGGSRRLNQNKKKRDIQIRRDMPISQNKLMPYSDNPSMIEEPAREHRRNPGTSTRKNRPSSRFKLGKFFQKWIMSSRHLKIPGQQQHVNLHDSARFPIKIRPWGDLLANELGCLAGYQLSRSLHRRYRNKLELSSLYEPLGAGGSSSRDLDLSSEHDEDEEHLNDRQHASSNTLFGANNPELSNVWSDRLEEGHEYFRFEEDEE
ncbi:hypothetical protein PGT21_031596 [Puccinia graminis f. sp. tritici]|uniref:Uncharacterized protein n=1 Tax=Puccinia graminis f. sp. tritici TaxID=56615 RepID=A0A5B0PJN3_PUCGR|nr:hypothetical protein PGT21_031596 [Puccinia graminis f. sp. tritici]